MAYIDWNGSFSVGVDQFDSDHKMMVKFINKLHESIVAGTSDAILQQILVGLYDYTVYHFSAEEKFMQMYEYPLREHHREEHQILIERLNGYIEKYKKGNDRISLELLSFLKEWLVNHIMITDIKYKEFFNEKGVD